MVENPEQYRITRRAARMFEHALRQANDRVNEGWSGPNERLLILAERDAIESQLEDLREQLAEYRAKRPRWWTRLWRWARRRGGPAPRPDTSGPIMHWMAPGLVPRCGARPGAGSPVTIERPYVTCHACRRLYDRSPARRMRRR